MDSTDTAPARGRRPPLPPRQSDASSMADDAPPPYDLIAHQQRAFEKATAATGAGTALHHSDPRSSSQDSLVPEPGEQQRRRRLLLIYIHGFMGNETSFRSFPAHVHNLLAVLLSETHVVHTKLYPRYRSKGNIKIARDDFSRWLVPHEGDVTDVVLLGHSMGGLLAAEVALMPAAGLASRPLRHRILGTINFDVPFLGMHPGIIKSGLASIFKSAEEPHDQHFGHELEQSATTIGSSQQEPASHTPSRMDTLWSKVDPNYNPKFENDVALPIRKGWRNAWHFVNKHSDDLYKSTKKLVSSHMEFGGAMANYGELKTRYARIRALEEPDNRVRQTVVEGSVPPRVRFINYYTVSTGRRKKSQSPLRRLSPSPHRSRPSSQASTSRASFHSVDSRNHDTAASTPSLNLPAQNTSDEISKSRGQDWEGAMESLQIGSSTPQPADSRQLLPIEGSQPLADLPPAPPPLGDISYIQDVSIRKLVEDQHAQAVDAYNKAVKEREKALQQHSGRSEGRKSQEPQPQRVKGKQPVIEKPEWEMTHSEREHRRLEKERQRMEAESRRLRGELEPEKEAEPYPVESRQSMESIPRIESRTPSMPTSTIGSVSTFDSNLLTPQQSTDTTSTKASKAGPKKDRKFCNLPPKDKNGQLDPCWVRVFMENVDEVGAHCGLFFVDERYERLVGDVAEKIEQWVLESHSDLMSRVTSPSLPENK